MQFYLNAACKTQTERPVRIRSIQAVRLSDGSPVAEVGLAFQYDAKAKQFDIFCRTLQSNGKYHSHTRIAHCAVGEKVSFALVSDKSNKMLKCELRKTDGTIRTFNTSYHVKVDQIRLAIETAEKAPDGAQASVMKEPYSRDKGNFPKAPNDKNANG